MCVYCQNKNITFMTKTLPSQALLKLILFTRSHKSCIYIHHLVKKGTFKLFTIRKIIEKNINLSH